MTSPVSDKPICQTCHKPHPWPDGSTPKHPFNNGDLPASATFGKKGADGRNVPPPDEATDIRPVQWPFDPVLRQALIDKGILTPEDLRNAEEKIIVITGQYRRGSSDTG